MIWHAIQTPFCSTCMLQCEGKYAKSSIVCHVINALEDRIDVLRPQQEVFRILHISHLGQPVLCIVRTQPFKLQHGAALQGI